MPLSLPITSTRTAQLPRHEFDAMIGRFAAIGTLINLLIALHLTLMPYRFDPGMLSGAGDMLTTLLSGPSDPDDQINNLMLLVPLGFCLGGLLRRRNLLVALTLTLLAGGIFATSVELIQQLLPERTSTVIDVTNNTLGAGAGWVAFTIFNLWVRSLRSLVVGTTLYLVGALIAAGALQFTTRLSNWDPAYPLLIGNEASGDRPWSGRVYELSFAATALDPAVVAAGPAAVKQALVGELLALYHFTEPAGLASHTDTAPALEWRGSATPPTLGTDVIVDADSWLESRRPPEELTRTAARHSQFTLFVTFAPASLEQSGPARIISLSLNPYLRNFTLGQEGDALVFRMRTPATGPNGLKPELKVSGVFADKRPHQVIVTYDGALLRMYIDENPQAHTLRLSPELALINLLLPPEVFAVVSDMVFYLYNASISLFRGLFYGLIALPLGLLLALLSMPRIDKPASKQRFVAYLSVTILSAPLIEGGLAMLTARAPNLDTMFIGALTSAAALLLFRKRFAEQ